MKNSSIPLPDPARQRHIPRSFSWVDHQLLRQGHLAACAATETHAPALYLLLLCAADARGLSYYSDKSMCRILNLDTHRLQQARTVLIQTGLIAWRAPYHQVLGLEHPQNSCHQHQPYSVDAARANKTQSIHEALHDLFTDSAAQKSQEHPAK